MVKRVKPKREWVLKHKATGLYVTTFFLDWEPVGLSPRQQDANRFDRRRALEFMEWHGFLTLHRLKGK